jgi:phage anti-repressor protein
MNELIAVSKHVIGVQTVETVSARELQAGLGNATDFSTWVGRQLEAAQLDENVDFVKLHKIVELSGQNAVEYFLTIEAAKHIAMLQRTELGKKYRQYFIDLEKRTTPMTVTEIIVQQAIALDAQAKQIAVLEQTQIAQAQTIKTIEARQEAFIEGLSYYTVLAYSNLHRISVDITTAMQLGKRASQVSRETGVLIDKVRDPRFGQVNAYQESVLKTVFAEMMT